MQLWKPKLIASWIAQLIAAAILLQTLFFKFTGAPESVYIFRKLGVEPWGRYASGAALAIAVITGAIGSHLTKLGIEVQNDRSLLFALALTVATGAALILFLRRTQLPILGPLLAPSCSCAHFTCPLIPSPAPSPGSAGEGVRGADG